MFSHRGVPLIRFYEDRIKSLPIQGEKSFFPASLEDIVIARSDEDVNPMH